MSSCFLCDASYTFTRESGSDVYNVIHGDGQGGSTSTTKYMKQLPIMVGSTGTGVDDQQHKNNNKQNYVSYKVKKLEFCCSYSLTAPVAGSPYENRLPDYVLIFKVPFRNPVFDYYFGVMKNFMLFSEPECVLDYKVLQPIESNNGEYPFKRPLKFNININKPFIVGPNDYVGVLYMFSPCFNNEFFVNASARVWFDVV